MSKSNLPNEKKKERKERKSNNSRQTINLVVLSHSCFFKFTFLLLRLLVSQQKMREGSGDQTHAITHEFYFLSFPFLSFLPGQELSSQRRATAVWLVLRKVI